MKRVIGLILAAVLVCAMIPMSAVAEDGEESGAGGRRYSEFSVVFDSGKTDEATVEKIKTHLLSGVYANEDRNVICTIFGHDLDSGTTIERIHNVREKSPRCRDDYYNFDICTRCDYYQYILQGSIYVVCH